MEGLSDSDRILGFVEDCRDGHVAPYPVGTRVISDHTGLSMYRVRTVVNHLLDDGCLAKMAAYPDHRVVLP